MMIFSALCPEYIRNLKQGITVLLVTILIPVSLSGQTKTDPGPDEAYTLALDQRIPESPEVTTGKFENGVTYYIRKNREPANRAELRLVVDVGSVLEDDDQLGLAHFLEHMAFNGTKNFKRQELVNLMESIGMRLGPHLNASTSFDETIYQLQVPTDNPEHIATAFQILEDWATALTLEPEEIELERGVVIEEWRLGQGARSRVRDKQYPIILKDSRYAERLPIGTLENLQNFDHESLRRFYHDWYRPELMAVIAVGDFDTAEIERLTRKHFEHIPPSANTRNRERYPIPEHGNTLFAIAADPEIPLTQVAIYHKIRKEYDWTISDYRQDLVERLYNTMLTTRFQEIARQPDAPFLGASSNYMRLIRPLHGYVLSAVVPESGIDRGIRTLLAEAERVSRFGFTETELERQKASLIRRMEQLYANRESQDSRSFAAEYTRAYLTGESIPGIDFEYALYRRFIPGITVEEVNRVGKTWINEANRVVVVTAPDKPDVDIPDEKTLDAIIASVKDMEITPYMETTTDEPLLANLPEGTKIVATRELEGGLTEWDLANGIKVVLKPTDFQKDQILFQGFSPGGTSLVSDEDFIPASSAATLIANGGVGNFNAIDLQRKLAGKIVNVSPMITEFDEGIRGSGSPADMETLFQLIYLRFTAPRADRSFFDVYKNQSRMVLQNRAANPVTAFGDKFVRMLYQDHPRKRPPSLDMVDRFDLEKSMAIYKDRFADASDFRFIIVGSFEPERIRPLVERYLGALPSNGREENWRDTGARTPRGVIKEIVHKGLEPQSRTQIAFTGQFNIYDGYERTRMSATARILQTRLIDVLRERLGNTYSVQVNRQMYWMPVEYYIITISFGSDPDNADKLTERLFAEIESLKLDGPAEQEVNDTKQSLLRDYSRGIERNEFWISQLSLAYRERGEADASEILAYPETVAALSQETIRHSFQKFFNMDNYIQLTLMPEE